MSDDTTCELKFLECIIHPKCLSCFQELQDNDIDWSLIAADTSCPLILNAIEDKFSKCLYMKGDEIEKNLFCDTFDNCVVYENETGDDDFYYEDDDKDKKKEKDDKDIVDCNALTECNFPGFKPNYIGDGICHEFANGCYNSKICNYDGGDCCADTCQNKTDYAQCGSDG